MELHLTEFMASDWLKRLIEIHACNIQGRPQAIALSDCVIYFFKISVES